MEQIILRLEEEYKNSKFMVSDDGYFLKILYNDKELINDQKFFNFIYNLSDEYLSQEESFRLAITFDYLGEIN